jgi:hypothetical protein
MHVRSIENFDMHNVQIGCVSYDLKCFLAAMCGATCLHNTHGD